MYKVIDIFLCLFYSDILIGSDVFGHNLRIIE